MSRDARIDRDFGDGTYQFRLGWGELVKLQEETDHGPLFVARNLDSDDARPMWVFTVIRLGLIGGGMDPTTALRMVRSYVEPFPLRDNAILARDVALAAWQGASDEAVGLESGGNSVDDLPNEKIRFAALYGVGAVMGFTPQEVDQMSVWQFMATADGYARAHAAKDDQSLTSAEKDELAGWLGI